MKGRWKAGQKEGRNAGPEGRKDGEKEETTKMILHHPPNNNHHLFLASSAKHFYASIIFIMLSRVPLTTKLKIARIILILNEVNCVTALIGPRFFQQNIEFLDKFRLQPFFYP